MPDIVAKYLNKDGLQTYNDSMPHSPTQMQEYVNDWLDEHPEASTTVEDESITTKKLADNAVTGVKIANNSIDASKIVNASITANKLAQTVITPTNFPTIPYEITRSIDGVYSVADILSAKDVSNFQHYYVDSVNGLDSNNGTSISSPVKSLKKALTLAANKQAYINIAEGSVFWDDDLYGEYLVRQSLVIDGNNSQIIWGVQNPNWVAYENKSGVYISDNLSDKPCINCVDMGADNKDMYGFYKGMTPAESIDTMVANSYFWDATNTVMYVYPREGGNVADIHPLRASYGLRWNHLTASVDTFMYLRNFDYIGSYFDSVRGTAFPSTQSLKYEGYFENITLSHGATGDQFPVSNYNVSYIWNCKAGWTKQDAFNHHMTGFVDTSNAHNCMCILVNCEATEAGWYETSNATTHNLYSAHEGMNVLRCNCNGNNSKGPLIADVNGCRSIALDCQVINAGYASSAISAALKFNDVQSTRPGFITLQRVTAYDVIHNASVGLICDCKLSMWNCIINGGININNELAVTEVI